MVPRGPAAALAALSGIDARLTGSVSADSVTHSLRTWLRVDACARRPPVPMRTWYRSCSLV